MHEMESFARRRIHIVNVWQDDVLRTSLKNGVPQRLFGDRIGIFLAHFLHESRNTIFGAEEWAGDEKLASARLDHLLNPVGVTEDGEVGVFPFTKRPHDFFAGISATTRCLEY